MCVCVGVHRCNPLREGGRADKDQKEISITLFLSNCTTLEIQIAELFFTPLSTKALGVLYVGRLNAPRHMVRMHICHKHRFSGDKLMHRPGFLETVTSEAFFFLPLTEVEQVNDRLLCELS